jgi:hypothetical protein
MKFIATVTLPLTNVEGNPPAITLNRYRKGRAMRGKSWSSTLQLEPFGAELLQK